MHFGVWIPDCRHLATPDIIWSTAVGAEQLGYDSVWVSDHVVVPHANIVNFGETVSAHGRELGEQMAVIADRVRPHLA
jgi:alkanesulfonate monooxygenase SsuD/methylene tetrahydromethanopterin reductase-like flavin-dependent oxidoreductase (luciferase family)